MPGPLSSFLFGAPHAARGRASDEPIALRVDHVLLPRDGAEVVLQGFDWLGRARVVCELALVCLERDGAGPEDEARTAWLRTASHRVGARFVRPGAGLAAEVHRRRFAAPGRVLASHAPGAAGCGALGMLALPAAGCELTAALAGEPLRLVAPPVIGIRLRGELPPGIEGADIVAALAQRLEGRGVGAVLECFGDGLASVPMADRIVVADRGVAATGALACVFPVDDRARGWLAARGRASDWRRFEGDASTLEEVVTLDLTGLAPAHMRTGSILGEEVTHVRIGPAAEDAELRRFARAMQGQRVFARVQAEVVLSGRAQQAVLSADGWAAALEAAGVTRIDREQATPLPEGAGVVVCGGRDEGFSTGALAAAAAARHGFRADPRADALERAAIDEPSLAALDPADVLEPALDAGGGPSAGGSAAYAPPPAFDGPVRGEVLLVLGDGVPCADILSPGARTQALRSQPAALAAQVYRARDPEAAARAAARGGGFVVAGRDYGRGGPGEEAARAVAGAGVRAILALSVEPTHRRLLALHGVLPLSLVRAADMATLVEGDELEIAALPEALEPDRPLVVRNLTRGMAYDVRHELDAHALDVVRAGGLLRSIVAASVGAA